MFELSSLLWYRHWSTMFLSTLSALLLAQLPCAPSCCLLSLDSLWVKQRILQCLVIATNLHPCNKRCAPYFDGQSFVLVLNPGFLIRIFLQSRGTKFKMENLGSRLTYTAINRCTIFLREKHSLQQLYSKKGVGLVGLFTRVGLFSGDDCICKHNVWELNNKFAPCNKRCAPYFDCQQMQ